MSYRYRNPNEELTPEEKEFDQLLEDPYSIEEADQKLTGRQIDLLADSLLRQDTRRELCRKCDQYGEETGGAEVASQFDEDGNPVVNESGDPLYLEFPEYKCPKGHKWFKGEGKARGIQGDNPILFEEHLKSRQQREIYTSVGTPDPSIVSGIYNRTHPQGRKTNSEEQRKKHGASFFRG